jgi:hypothetical protein
MSDRQIDERRPERKVTSNTRVLIRWVTNYYIKLHSCILHLSRKLPGDRRLDYHPEWYDSAFNTYYPLPNVIVRVTSVSKTFHDPIYDLS